MKLPTKDLVLVFGAACAWAQTLLDRSGIIPYGGATSSIPQEIIWACIVGSAVVGSVTICFFGARRTIPILAAAGIALSVFGCFMLLLPYWGLGGGEPVFIDAATISFAVARAPVLQIWTFYLASSDRAPRLTLSVAVLASCTVLLTASLPSGEMHLVSYLAVSVAGAALIMYGMKGKLKECGNSRKSFFGGMGLRAAVLFCALQVFPTFISGGIGTIEMYVPFSLDPWQQVASLISGAMLLVLLVGALNVKRVADSMLAVIPVLLTVCMILPLGTAKAFSPKPLFILATQLGGDFEVLNIYRNRNKHDVVDAGLPFVGQTLVFVGLFMGSVLTNAIIKGFGIDVVESGVYTSIAFAGLLVLLAALLVLLMKIQADRHSKVVNVSGLPLETPVSPQANVRQYDGVLAQIRTRYGLTPREEDMILYLLSGYSRQKIAQELFIAESTVKSHINNLYKKLGIHKRDDLLDMVVEFQEIEAEDRNEGSVTTV